MRCSSGIGKSAEKIDHGEERKGAVYTMGADGANPVNLTNNPAADYAPAYAPDGSKIAFASTRSGNDEIHRMNRDGSSPRRLTRHAALDGTMQQNRTNDESYDGFPDWQPLAN